MRIYADSSALIKRVVDERESDDLEAALDHHLAHGGVFLSSSLAWIEVSRALRRLQAEGEAPGDVYDAIEVALSGVVERPINDDIVSLARRLGPDVLRSLDAIHLATALVLDVDMVLSYDERLTEACRHHGLEVRAPGR